MLCPAAHFIASGDLAPRVHLSARVGQANGHGTVPVLVTGASSTLRAQLEREISDLGAVVTSERPETVIVLDDQNPQECIESVIRLRQRFPTAPLLVVTTRGSEQLAVAAFRAGAADYLNWPVPHPELERAWS